VRLIGSGSGSSSSQSGESALSGVWRRLEFPTTVGIEACDVFDCDVFGTGCGSGGAEDMVWVGLILCGLNKHDS